jgi:hypothetical protein
MSLVPSFVEALQPLAVFMTAPSFDSLSTLVAGWIFAPRRTVTGMIVAAGAVGTKHHSAFHRFFASASWSLDRLGLAVFDRLTPHLSQTVFLAGDDTLARKRGLKVFGVGMHYDPILSSRGKAIVNWGHSWVVLCVLVRFPLWPERTFALPILFRLYLNEKAAAKHRRVYRTRPELLVELLTLLCKARETRRFHLVADSAYGGQSVLLRLPKNCDLTSRLPMDARLYGPPSERIPGKPGRPRVRGESLPSPRAMLQARGRRATLAIYGRRDEVRYRDAVARIYSAPRRALRIVAVEPLTGGRKPQAFYSTRSEATALDVLAWYADRWSVEVAFHDAKQSLGFEEPQGWSRQAVERTAPIAMLLYDLIVMWFVESGRRDHRSLDRPWYKTAKRPSFADMLRTLRRESLREEAFAWAGRPSHQEKILDLLDHAANLAA